MAARPDQNLQIGLIISAILIVALTVATWLGWSSYSAEAKKSTQLAAEKQQEQDAVRRVTEENGFFREFVGYPAEESLDAVQAQYKKDMESFGENFGDANRNYRKLMVDYATEASRLSKEASEAKGRETLLQAELRKKEQEKEDQIDQYKKQLAAAEQDAAKERNAFKSARAQFETQQAQLEKKLDAQRNQNEQQVAQLQTTIGERKERVDKLEVELRRTLDKVPPDVVTLDVADGRITYVNQREGKVWLNLGERDSIRPQLTFSVLAQDSGDAGAAEVKGTLEVVRVLGENMAEARITDDDPHDPILPGDQIYSQVWDPGVVQHFALAGVIDLNGDGRNDLELAKNLIRQNGGAVDAYVEEDGKVVGAISVNTTQLVLGDQPDDPKLSDARTGWQELSKQADQFGVSTVQLGRFLRQMGYTPEDRTLTLGPGSRASDFRATDPLKGKFRPRSPYATP
ncbi:hypothetical protein Pla175_20210 [Pirellulimonas nuda]|uniref:Uncharacterized protein n=1 Tax=Pirellulimonas nuda TaxID=2528009 RepID=A0A518DAX8_9BACT|nr:hypothetical protein [Pirellulimonas nuda]QDU88641.1 hypothetical protein Pla175_20210 [Pirellulimonas nuda]